MDAEKRRARGWYSTTFCLIDQETKMSFFERRHTRKFCVNFIPNNTTDTDDVTPDDTDNYDVSDFIVDTYTFTNYKEPKLGTRTSTGNALGATNKPSGLDVITLTARDRKRMSMSSAAAGRSGSISATSSPSKGHQQQEVRCKCGYFKRDHLPHRVSNIWSNSQEWRRELHIETIDYGHSGFNSKLKFISQIDNYDHTADFTVIADDSHPEVAMQHLVRDWHLDLPNIVISVAGSDKALGIISRHANRFKTAFMKTVCCTKSWVITGGTSNGVDKLVLDALKEAQLLSWMGSDAPKFRIIGFPNWNCVRGHEKISRLVYDNPRGLTVEYVVQKNTHTDEDHFEPSLNPLISHFLCIEGGLKGVKGQEVFVRSAVEESLAGAAEEEVLTGFKGYGIPTVLILMKGEFDVFERAANAVCKGIGIVICEGLGGATDILHYAFRMSNKNSLRVTLTIPQQLKVMQMMETMHKRKSMTKLYSAEPFEAARHMHMIHQCLRHKHLIFCYKTQRIEEPLDETIVRALLAGNAAKKKDSLELALHWNRCDETVREMCEIKDMSSRINANELFTKALLEGKVDFVQLFLDYGFDIKLYLNSTNLGYLYETGLKTFPPLHKYLASKLGAKSTYKLKNIFKLVQDVTCIKLRPKKQTLRRTNDKGRRKIVCFEDPYTQLCLYSVFTNQISLASFFWTKSQYPTVLGLICYKMCQELVFMFPQNEVLARAEMQENSNVFKTLSLSVLDACWKTSQHVTEKMLSERTQFADYKTVVDVASLVDMKEFIAKPCVQKFLVTEWKGGMRLTVLEVLKNMLTPYLVNRQKDLRAEMVDKTELVEDALKENEAANVVRRRRRISSAMTVKNQIAKFKNVLHNNRIGLSQFSSNDTIEEESDEESANERLASLRLRHRRSGFTINSLDLPAGNERKISRLRSLTDVGYVKTLMKSRRQECHLLNDRRSDNMSTKSTDKEGENQDQDKPQQQQPQPVNLLQYLKMERQHAPGGVRFYDNNDSGSLFHCDEFTDSPTDSGHESEPRFNDDDFLDSFADMDERHAKKGSLRPQLVKKKTKSILEDSLSSGAWAGLHVGRKGSVRPDADGIEEILEQVIAMGSEDEDYHVDGSSEEISDSEREHRKCSKPKVVQSFLNYYQAPVTKFMLYLFAYLVFLVVITLAAFDVQEGTNSVYGFIGFMFMLCYAVESYRQLAFQQVAFRLKFKLWAMNEWNLIEWTYLSIGMASFPVAAIGHSTGQEGPFQFLAMLLYVVTLFMMYIRLMRFYQCSSRLGPMWIMIRKMLVETLIALCVFAVILTALGLCIFVISNPVDPSLGDPIYEPYYSYKWIFLRPYFMLIGKFFHKLTMNGRNVGLTRIMAVAFKFFGNALMMNLLIAIYKGIFEYVINKADEEWKTEMYWLITEFKGKTILPPPFSIFESVWLIGKKLLCCDSTCSKSNRSERSGKRKPTKHQRRLRQMLEIFERHGVAEMLRRSLTDAAPEDIIREITQDRVTSIGEIDDTVLSMIRITEEQARKRQKQKEELRIEFLKSIR
ncbi:uncharacterized protein LOC142342384 isoform X2 [Convolutriloba macropyga]|uniref:uncharacterized protein LOC142342384 isoform X2 n=1 Tax=Convolutriloba macropyga TaxID=536237 RepID=UPI003F51B39C